MDDVSLMEHYVRIKHQMENERLLTFEEMLNLTKVSPELLRRTISVLAPRLCLYKRMKGEPEEDEYMEPYWTLQDLQDILDVEEQGDPTSQKNKDKYKEDQKNHKKVQGNTEDKKDLIDNSLEEIAYDESHYFDPDEEILSFEELVKLTGSHPLYLERCLCHLALEAETE